MSTSNDKIGRFMGPALIGAVTLLAAAGAVNLVTMLVRIGPHVGDIISFEGSGDSLTEPVRLLVNRADQFACVLDLDTLSRRGGSLVLEARLPGEARAFFLHWAGDRTTSDAADCGRTADLIVDRHDMDLLSMAAGGYGVGRKSMAMVAGTVP